MKSKSVARIVEGISETRQYREEPELQKSIKELNES